MKRDALIYGQPADAAAAARDAEALGYDGVISLEAAHDPFVPLTVAATVTERVDLITGIAVAFARNPMSIAITASDIHRLSHGRMVLGLGSQIRPHITKRFSMPWSEPAARMREFVMAVRAIWSSWQNGTPLSFRGDYYQHTLMTPMFDQGPSEVGWPRIFVAGVGPQMTSVAGEVGDGMMVHGFTTPEYFREVTLVNVDRGLAASGRTRADIEITLPVMTATGRDDQEITERVDMIRRQIAFYGSTPAYRPVLEHHGWGDLGVELNRLSKLGQWSAMNDAVDRAIVESFAIVGHPDTVPAEIERRFGSTIDRVQMRPESWFERFDT